jgi:threonine/homoserine/homoserine lactone efflux protein
MPSDSATALTGFGLGVALASAPGPVQAVLLAEAVRGGVLRGLRALAGTALTFATMLLIIALGLSVARPSGAVLGILKLSGGVLLLWLAADALRSRHKVDSAERERGGVHPTVRGILAILLNPGGWLFLAAVASPLFLSAARGGGRGTAVLTALALAFGAALGDFGLVVLGGLGLRRARASVVMWIQRTLAAVLAGLGVWLIVQGLTE